MWIAPPNRYTNISISRIGSTNAVISESTLRSDRRSDRPTIVRASVQIRPATGAGRLGIETA